MYVNNRITAKYEQLALECVNSNTVKMAMLQATKSSMVNVKNRLVIDLLTVLRRKGIGTNSVEFNINNNLSILSEHGIYIVKMKMMRAKVNDAHRVYKEHVKINARKWRMY